MTIYKTRATLHFETKYPNGPESDFLKFVFESNRPYQERYQAVMEAFDGNPMGVEFGDKNGRYAVIITEMSNPEYGDFRIQFFDKRGFYSHDTFKTIGEAVELMTRDGFLNASPGALDRLAADREWHFGTRMTDLIRQRNCRQISWEQYYELSEKLNEEYMAAA